MKSNVKETLYLVSYTKGDFEDFREIPLFVTPDKDFADRYAEKFERVVKAVVPFYQEKCRLDERGDEQSNVMYDKLFKYTDINGCYVEEITLITPPISK